MLSAQDCVPPAALHLADTFLPKSALPDRFVDAVHDMLAGPSSSLAARLEAAFVSVRENQYSKTR